jgi:predicted transcriptional regulator
MNSHEAHPDLTAEIVSKYVGHHKIPADQLPELIATVYKAIGQLGNPIETEETRTPAVSVRQSVRQDYVVCLDCGYKGLVLRRHLSVRHGLNPDEYRQRWGLKRDHLLTAAAYSERRSTMAKALGLGRGSANPAMAEKPEAALVATSKPVRKPRRATRQTEPIEPPAEPGKPARTKSPAGSFPSRISQHHQRLTRNSERPRRGWRRPVAYSGRSGSTRLMPITFAGIDGRLCP